MGKVIYQGFGYDTDQGFGLVTSVFWIIGGLIAAVILCSAVYALYVWNKNNHAPVKTAEVEVYTKRQDFSRFRHSIGTFGHYHSMYVRYFVTFMTANDGPVKLKVKSRDFDLLREGEKGTLTFQGTRYLGFSPAA